MIAGLSGYMWYENAPTPVVKEREMIVMWDLVKKVARTVLGNLDELLSSFITPTDNL